MTHSSQPLLHATSPLTSSSSDRELIPDSLPLLNPSETEKPAVVPQKADQNRLQKSTQKVDLSVHPVMVDLKLKAKKLLKALKSIYPEQQWSLMKAQELVSVQLDFESFYDATEHCKKTALASAPLKGKINQNPYLGRPIGFAFPETEFNTPLYLPVVEDSEIGRMLMMGDELQAEKLSLFMAQDAIRQGQGLTWINGRAGTDTGSLIELAKSLGREDDLYVVQLTPQGNPLEGLTAILPRLNLPLSETKDFITSIFESLQTKSPEISALIDIVLPFVCELRDRREILLDFEVIASYMGIHNLCKASLRYDITEAVREPICHYLRSLFGTDYRKTLSHAALMRERAPEAAAQHQALVNTVIETFEQFQSFIDMGKNALNANLPGQRNLLPSELTPPNSAIILIDLPVSGLGLAFGAEYLSHCLISSIRATPRSWATKDVGKRRLLMWREAPLLESLDAFDLGAFHLDALLIDFIISWSSPSALRAATSHDNPNRRFLNVDSSFEARIISAHTVRQEFARYQREERQRLLEHEANKRRFPRVFQKFSNQGPYDAWAWMKNETIQAGTPWVLQHKNKGVQFFKAMEALPHNEKNTAKSSPKAR